MALPSNTFMFNYNAREYVPSTRTFPKTTGQLFDENLVLNADPAEVGKYYVDFTGKELYMRKMFSTTGDNPFNVTSTNPNLTFVCKTSEFSSSSANIFVSRSTATTHNCLIRGDRIILNTDYGVFVPTASPQIIAITINSNGVLVRKELDASGNVLTSVTETVEFRNGSNGIAFFRGYADTSKEYFQNKFYWMYLSRETLTDEEILQVINHNEPKPIKIPYNNLYRNGVNLNYQQPKPHDYSKDYLTINVISGGTIEWIHGTGTTAMSIQYSKDNGANWTTITSTESGTSISVDAGDKVIFKGSNSAYNSADNIQKRHAFLITGCTANVAGNIMSMIAGDNFTGSTTIIALYTFAHLFFGCTGIISAENLIMPDNVVQYCYLRMFQNCTSLTTAPVLPAPSLTTTCYGLMFGGCSSLTYIKCLATSGINSSWSTSEWVSGVAASGTFVKKSGVSWPTGNNGIPTGWTIQEE